MDTILCYQPIHENKWIQSYAINLYMRVDGYNPMLSTYTWEYMDTILCYQPILENKWTQSDAIQPIHEIRWIQSYAINLYMRINGYNSMLSTYTWE